MGYYTSYSLKVIEGSEDLIKELRNICDEAGYALEEDGSTSDSTKWYSSEKDMRDFSLLHPEAVFELKGGGEESGDLWVAYFKAGKMQMCKAKIYFDEYDPTKLE